MSHSSHHLIHSQQPGIMGRRSALMLGSAAAAQHPTIRALQRSASIHAARHEPRGRTSAVFFDAGQVSFMSAAQPCAVAAEEGASQLRLALSDPTQTLNRIQVELDIEGGTVLEAGPAVTVSRRDGRLVVSADVYGAAGASRTVRIKYTLTPEAVAATLKSWNKAGTLSKNPYKQLDEGLKALAKSIRKSQDAVGAYAALRLTLQMQKGLLGNQEFAVIDDLVSRLSART